MHIHKNVQRIERSTLYVFHYLHISVNIILISLCMYTYICMCYIYIIFIFHEICSVSIVSAYSSQGFMGVGNISITLTLYICPCKTHRQSAKHRFWSKELFTKCSWRAIVTMSSQNEVCCSTEWHNCWHTSDCLSTLTWVWSSNLASCPPEDSQVAIHDGDREFALGWIGLCTSDHYKEHDWGFC